MNFDGKKISFGFSKLSKKPNIQNPSREKESVELIDCLEGAEIKVKNAIEKVEKSPLVIPIKGVGNNIVSQIEQASIRSKKIKTETKDEDLRPDSELTIEELAARQLLREAREKLEHNKDTTKIHVLPIEENKPIQDGIEPSMDDYENVPIGDFGLACLRGMGWKEGQSIGKNPYKFVKPREPDLRPKGLGLGAQKIIDIQTEELFDNNGKKLVHAKGSFGKIVAGSHKGKFCEVQFCHEWSGRVVVKLSNNEILTLPELLVTPLSKEDYIRGSKVINNAKYEQYKQMEEYGRSSDNKISVDEIEQSSSNEKNNSSNEPDVKQENKSRNKEYYDKNHIAIKNGEFDENVGAASDDKYTKSKISNDNKYRKEFKSNHESRRSRNKYTDMNESRQTKYERESSDENDSQPTRKRSTTRSTDSTELHYARSQSNSKVRDNEKNGHKSRYEGNKSENSYARYDRKKSKKGRRNRSCSSSEGCNKRSVERKNFSKGKHRKYSNEKRSPINSDEDHEKKRSKKYAKSHDLEEQTSYVVKHKKKNEKHRKRRESSSE